MFLFCLGISCYGPSHQARCSNMLFCLARIPQQIAACFPPIPLYTSSLLVLAEGSNAHLDPGCRLAPEDTDYVPTSLLLSSVSPTSVSSSRRGGLCSDSSTCREQKSPRVSSPQGSPIGSMMCLVSCKT